MKQILEFLVTIICLPFFCIGCLIGFICRPFVYGYIKGYTTIETKERIKLISELQQYTDEELERNQAETQSLEE